MGKDKIAALEAAYNKVEQTVLASDYEAYGPEFRVVLSLARAHLEQLKVGDDALKAAKRLLGKYLIAWGSANKDMQEVRQSEGYKDIDTIIAALTPKGANNG